MSSIAFKRACPHRPLWGFKKKISKGSPAIKYEFVMKQEKFTPALMTITKNFISAIYVLLSSWLLVRVDFYDAYVHLTSY
jgi:hypothetical protein